MSFVRGISVFFDYWGTLVFIICSLIGVWILISQQEWCRRQWQFMKSAATMPGPPALPLIGNALYFACTGDELLNRILEIGQSYNVPFRFWMGPKLFVIMRNPRDIEVILNSPIATNKPYEYRFLASYLGRGIVTESGSIHRAHRKLIMPMVNGKALNAFLECFDRQSRRCVECLKDHVDTEEFDIIHFMDNCTMDIILALAIPRQLAELIKCPSVQYIVQIGRMKTQPGELYSSAIGLAHERSMKAWLYPDWIYTRTSPGQQFASAMKVLHEFTETLIARKKQEHYASEIRFDVRNDSQTAVLDRMITHNEKTQMMDEKRFRDEMANIWMPAQDPTALTSSFLFMMLGMHPEIQDKVRAEVGEVVGDGDIKLEHLPKLKYLEMVFKETVRLFPVGPVILRELQDDLNLETCIAPKGCTIALLGFMAHRDPNYWTEPEKFDPDRFTPENSVGRHPYAYIPFSSGIRGCIGRQYATMMMKVLVARVVQKYRISSKGSLEMLRLKAGVSIRSIDGYKVSITEV